ncbi:hypothetical protein HanIR_Chr03g0148341 [Helianthus annuus]|nr:hypothetical protein HanIR_Chr03g0148341 [Helianthus annuus]
MRYSFSFYLLSDVGPKNEGCKPYRAGSRAREPSQAKLELGSFTNRAEPSWLVYNRAAFEPSSFRTFFERVSSELRATSFLNTPSNSHDYNAYIRFFYLTFI